MQMEDLETCLSVTVDMVKENCCQMLIAKQGDINSRKFTVKLTSNGVKYKIPDGTIARYAITKPYKVAVWNDCNKIENDTVYGTFTEDTLADFGIFPMQIELYLGDKKISSSNFKLKITQSSRNADEQVGKNEYGVLDNLIKKSNAISIKTDSTLEDIKNVKDDLLLSEEERIANEDMRIHNEQIRQNNIQDCINATCDAVYATDDAIQATRESEIATDKANRAADRCDSVIDGTGVILQDEKGVANGVATLDENVKIPNEQINTSFVIATERLNITSEEKLNIILGKIEKWFSDLKTGAFSYVCNELTETNTGYVLDARQGTVLDNKKINKSDIVSSLDIIQNGKVMDGITLSNKLKLIDENINNIELDVKTMPQIHSGITDPLNTVGKNGDIYIKFLEPEVV